MPVRVKPDGTVEFDTMQEYMAYVEAERLRKSASTAPSIGGNIPARQTGTSEQQRGGDMPPPQAVPADSPAEVPGSEWARLVAELSGTSRLNARKALTFVKAAGDGGISREKLIAALETNRNGLGGILGGLAKACQRASLTSSSDGHLPPSVIRLEGGTYFAGPLLRANNPPK